MIEHKRSQPRDGREAASIVFNLPGYDVVDAVDLPLGGRRVVVQARDRDDACPVCGALSARIHAWARQRVKDLSCGGDAVEVVVRKPRMVCAEPACPRRTFTQATDSFHSVRGARGGYVSSWSRRRSTPAALSARSPPRSAWPGGRCRTPSMPPR